MEKSAAGTIPGLKNEINRAGLELEVIESVNIVRPAPDRQFPRTEA
jgi:D-mannonate dehydratase